MLSVADQSKKKTFVPADSIVREIWGSTDITLFIFAGAAAEFALNRQADWLYFTGRLPGDPIGRLFSTVRYAKNIIFHDHQKAMLSIDNINHIHQQVETKRGARIPDESYKDVLYMLIHYSIGAFELLERPLQPSEKDEVVDVFVQMGRGMVCLCCLCDTATGRSPYRYQQAVNLQKSRWTIDLFCRYREHLGYFRYFLMLQLQPVLAPPHVNKLLNRNPSRMAKTLLIPYRIIRRTGWQRQLIRIMVPQKFRAELKEMEG